MKIVGPDRDKVIENIKEATEKGELNKKVEIGDPELTDEEKQEVLNKYLRKKNKVFHKINDAIVRRFVKEATRKETRETKIIGLNNIKEIDTGAIITSNHFNPTDSLTIKKMAKKAGKKKLYIVSQETNLAMTGLLGYIMNHSDLIPISDQIGYMKNDFQKIFKKTLEKKNFILIYPEQEMWFNYRKPRTPKLGAYFYASKYNVPIISCFVEIKDKKKNYNEEFKDVKYIVHVLKPIYPDKDKTDKENAAWMAQRDYSQKIEAYEEAYGKEMNYEFKEEDIAGWITDSK